MASILHNTRQAQIQNLKSILEMIEESLDNITLEGVRSNLLSIFTDPKAGMDSIVGREDIKNAVSQRIYMFVTDPKSVTTRYLNMAFLGGSGLGKTRLARFVAHAYNRAGIFAKEDIMKADAKDFMSSYVASGSHMTHALLESGLETVVFFDEAYSLGGGIHDAFQIQNGAFSAIVAHTEENKGLSALIVCGYHDKMERDFFGMNEGLHRRFPDRFHIQNYTSEELAGIFIAFLEDGGIHISEDAGNIAYTIIKKIYAAQPLLFDLQAGDMETLSSMFIEIDRTLISEVSERDKSAKRFFYVVSEAMKRFILLKQQ